MFLRFILRLRPPMSSSSADSVLLLLPNPFFGCFALHITMLGLQRWRCKRVLQ